MKEYQDKLADHADWKEGMNAFRLQVMQSLAIINEEIETIKDKIKETP